MDDVPATIHKTNLNIIVIQFCSIAYIDLLIAI